MKKQLTMEEFAYYAAEMAPDDIRYHTTEQPRGSHQPAYFTLRFSRMIVTPEYDTVVLQEGRNSLSLWSVQKIEIDSESSFVWDSVRITCRPTEKDQQTVYVILVAKKM